MHGIVRMAMLVGVLAPFAHAAAESSVEREARCNAYAERAVARYDQAVAHAQCKIQVNLVWQPSREFHYGACMNASRDAAEINTKTRDGVLQACATRPAQGVAMPLPTEIKECERSILKFCGTWQWNGGQYGASWANGARAVMTVTRFDGHSIALHRVDAADSSSAGMMADYLGDVDGGQIKGKVTYTWPGHMPPVGYGTWDATFTPPASQAMPSSPPSVIASPTAPAPVERAGNAGARSATPGAAASSQNVGNGSAEECPLPAVPVSWLDPSNERSVGQLWKIDGGIRSYTDAIEHEPARYAIVRPMFWKRWAACAPPQFKERIADVSVFWIWISDDRRDAKLFDLSSCDHTKVLVFSVPAELVLADEARKPNG